MATIWILEQNPAEIRQQLTKRHPEHLVQFICSDADARKAIKISPQGPDYVLGFRCQQVSDSNQQTIAKLSNVRWFQIAGAGFDHMGDLNQIPSSVQLTNSSGVLAPFQAETVIAAMMALNGNFPAYQRQQQQGIWKPLQWRAIAGQRLLIVGAGHIGQQVAQRAKALGLEVVAVRSRPQPMTHVDACYPTEQLDQQLAKADIVSLHLPYQSSTHHLFNHQRFASMKPGSLFLNTARGKIVDTDALLSSLEKLGGVYLDVFEQEPLPPEHPLWQSEKVMITPHYCDSVTDWKARFAAFFSENLERLEANQQLLNRIR